MSNLKMEVSPLRGLRFDNPSLARENGGEAPLVTAPPYDVIAPAEHQALLDASEHNIVRLTLGDRADASGSDAQTSYADRAALLRRWVDDGVLLVEDEPCFYVYEIDYTVPGTSDRRRMLGFIGLGRLHPFEDGIVLRHEETFEKTVEDRRRLLEATRANLESIFLLYSDPEREIDAALEEAANGEPVVSVEAKPGEIHAIYPVRDMRLTISIAEKMREQRPLIADGHHRYTTSLNYSRDLAASGEEVPGSEWQLMTFTNLFSDGLTILATHRLLKLRDGADVTTALARLEERFDRAEGSSDDSPGDSSGGDDWHLIVETAEGSRKFRVPDDVRAARQGVGRTDYALLRDVVIGEWLREWVDDEPKVSYYKEGTGESDALQSGEGDILFRLRPVSREEFRNVSEGGEVFPHKTTYFYPKLWSGLVLWSLDEPAPLALR
jgi:uncharacterized protein (DUF1015 family)